MLSDKQIKKLKIGDIIQFKSSTRFGYKIVWRTVTGWFLLTLGPIECIVATIKYREVRSGRTVYPQLHTAKVLGLKPPD